MILAFTLETTMRRTWQLVLATALACGGDSTGPKTTIAGTWRLQTINGRPLPFIREEPGSSKIELTSDVYTLADNGTFTKLIIVRAQRTGTMTRVVATHPGAFNDAAWTRNRLLSRSGNGAQSLFTGAVRSTHF